MQLAELGLGSTIKRFPLKARPVATVIACEIKVLRLDLYQLGKSVWLQKKWVCDSMITSYLNHLLSCLSQANESKVKCSLIYLASSFRAPRHCYKTHPYITGALYLKSHIWDECFRSQILMSCFSNLVNN